MKGHCFTLLNEAGVIMNNCLEPVFFYFTGAFPLGQSNRSRNNDRCQVNSLQTKKTSRQLNGIFLGSAVRHRDKSARVKRFFTAFLPMRNGPIRKTTSLSSAALLTTNEFCTIASTEIM